MSVLPDGATLASFFILLIILMLATILAALDWGVISAAVVRVQRHSIDQFYRLLPHLTVAQVFHFLVFELPANELLYGFHLLQPVRRNKLYPNQKFSRRKFVVDIVRFLFLPLWIALRVILYTISALRSLPWRIYQLCTLLLPRAKISSR
jgi:hypothetical protein